MCTLHSFPHTIDHCLTFARSEFEGLLEHSPAEANAFLLDPEKCAPPPAPTPPFLLVLLASPFVRFFPSFLPQ